jgi:hypothetical protein
MRPIGTPVPRSASATARTVPSPPAASTTVAPLASTVRVAPWPASSRLVSTQIELPQPAAFSAALTAFFRRAVLPLIGL